MPRKRLHAGYRCGGDGGMMEVLKNKRGMKHGTYTRNLAAMGAKSPIH